MSLEDLGLEPCSVWSNTLVIARKAHRCDCCRGPISMGVQYRRHFSVFDGDPCSEKVCPICIVLLDVFETVHHGSPTPSYFGVLLADLVQDAHRGVGRRRGADEYAEDHRITRNIRAAFLRQKRAHRPRPQPVPVLLLRFADGAE